MKSAFRLYILSIASVLILAACGGGGTAQPDEPVRFSTTPGPTRTPTGTPTATPVVVRGTVSIWHSWQEAQVPALLRAINEFQKQYPSVLFDVQYVPELDLKTGFEQASVEQRAPTVLIAPGEWGPSFYDAGMVIDLSPLVGPELLNTLNPAAVQAVQYQSSLIGLPVDLRGVVLYRNAGLIPQPAATFDELIRMSEAITQGNIFGAVLDRSFFFAGGHLFGLGGELMEEDGRPAFNNPAGTAWINLLRSFEQAGPPDFFSDNDLNLFIEGRVGFLIDGTWNRQALVEAIGAQNLAIDIWPIHENGSLAGFVQTENIYLTPHALEEEFRISWLFIEHFLEPASQSLVANVGLVPAINGSPVNVAASEMQIDDPLILQAMEALADGVAYPLAPQMPVYATQLEIALQSVYDDRASPAAALQAAEDAVRQALAEQTATPFPALEVSATPTP